MYDTCGVTKKMELDEIFMRERLIGVFPLSYRTWPVICKREGGI